MATDKQDTINVFRNDYKQSGVLDSHITRNSVWRRQYLPDKVSGGFATLPNGSKFRLPTAYKRRSVELGLGAGQDFAYINAPFTPGRVTTSSGGYAPDILFGANCPILPLTGTVGRFQDFPSAPLSMKNEASTKALLNISDQKAGIAEDLATFRQTLGLIKHPAGSLLSLLKEAYNDRSIRQYLFKSWRQLVSEGPLTRAASKYLEYVYGWKPLMSDIYGVIALLKEQGNKDLLLSGTGHSMRQQATSGLIADDFSLKHETELMQLTDVSKVSCKIWGRIDPQHAGLRALNQLGLINPFSLSYELLPWSFVVDWFVPIGPALQALTASAGLNFVSATTSVRTKINGTYRAHIYAYDSKVKSQVYATGTVSYDGYSRSVNTDWPSPGPWVNPQPFSGDRSLKALALAITNLRNLRI
ncbi:TPA_asm: maturation protein [ssRNA phage Esthiorhiza.2_35]|uniref:Maturation protein n=2 Tax=Fiersviridae TaxID=2842319 RepID=A0A8S5L408_9VIRU|nr:maturation protein [ssRNA phage Esthiorhiza.2_35]QDH86590.1 MAG: hypothetical protein H2RhizoLitter492136_000003 [Leviviridae sp.]DAD52111.1 TPA_asm: maturation protein [ssRNA phage Esthiorhiza.2_35]